MCVFNCKFKIRLITQLCFPESVIGQETWIGLYQIDSSSCFDDSCTGLFVYYSKFQDYSFVTGTSISSVGVTSDKCVLYNPSDQSYIATSCDYSATFICQYDCSTGTKKKFLFDFCFMSNYFTDEYYEFLPGVCGVSHLTKTFEEAEATCLSENATVIETSTPEHESYLTYEIGNAK